MHYVGLIFLEKLTKVTNFLCETTSTQHKTSDDNAKP